MRKSRIFQRTSYLSQSALILVCMPIKRNNLWCCDIEKCPWRYFAYISLKCSCLVRLFLKLKDFSNLLKKYNLIFFFFFSIKNVGYKECLLWLPIYVAINVLIYPLTYRTYCQIHSLICHVHNFSLSHIIAQIPFKKTILKIFFTTTVVKFEFQMH